MKLYKAFLTTALCVGLLTGCGQGKPPSASWENASKGSYSAAISSNSSFTLIGSINNGGSLWDIKTNKRLFNWNHKQGEFSTIIACAFSPEGLFALTADHQTMVLWDTTSGEALTYWTAPNEVMSVTLTPNGNYALLGLEDYSAVLFDVKRGGIQRSFYHEDRVRSVAMSEDGRLAVTGSEDQTAALWDVSSGQKLQQWQHDDEVVTVAISAAGDKAFTVAKYDRAVIWDTQTGKAVGQLPLGASAMRRGLVFTSAAFSPDGKLLLTGSADRQIQLWDTRTLKQIDHWTVPKRSLWQPTSASILALSFAGNNVFYAIASNGFTHRLTR